GTDRSDGSRRGFSDGSAVDIDDMIPVGPGVRAGLQAPEKPVAGRLGRIRAADPTAAPADG
ncbi:MAG: hypothetical protein JW990_10950, partial [Thermoleophilia bacterium]|nr:hypothetical protein [Thermoleophilia bacterium]